MVVCSTIYRTNPTRHPPTTVALGFCRKSGLLGLGQVHMFHMFDSGRVGGETIRVPTSPFSARLPSLSKRSEPFMCVGVSLMMSEAIKSFVVCKCIARW
ncbi:hypothetical protein Hanom_Chr16g01450441 [Helianthus anomalus]